MEDPDALRSQASRRYHHGDLKRALVEAALDDVRERGHAALSLRGLAASVGVSPTAVYRHFPDLDTLLAASAAEAFRRFSAAIGSTPASIGLGKPTVEDLGRAYLQFAATHPGLYGLIFGANFGTVEDDALRTAADAAFETLVDAVAAELPEGLRPEARQRAVVIWSGIHGAADLSAKRLLTVPADDRCALPPALDAVVAALGRIARGA